MALIQLRTLVLAFERFEAANLKSDPTNFAIVGPSLTLFLSGFILSGKLIGPLTYNHRQGVAIGKHGNEIADDLLNVAFSDDVLQLTSGQIPADDQTEGLRMPLTVYLQQVRVLTSGMQPLRIDNQISGDRIAEIAVNLDSVQAWVFGMDLEQSD